MKIFLRLLLFVVLIFPLCLPFLERGYFPTHDGEWAIIRLAEMHREVREGHIPPRWSSYLNHGYGYPLFLFTYPFPYYVGEVINIAGFNLVDSIKAVFILSIVLSGIGMWFLVSQLWGEKAAWVATALYLYAPYRISNLYIRGSLGESLILALFPLLFLFFYKLKYSKNPALIVINAVLIAVLIQTHNALSVLFLPFLGFWIAYLYRGVNKRFLVKSLMAGGLGFLLSIYFWLPVLFEKKFIQLAQNPLANKYEHFLSISDLTSRSWDFSIQPPFQLGVVHIGLFILCCISFLFFKKDLKTRLFFIGITLMSLFMVFSLSHVLWQLPVLKEIDFPWRMLGISIFLLSLTGAVFIAQSKKTWLTVVTIIFIILSSISYIKTQDRFEKEDGYYETNDATTTSADELMPIWFTLKSGQRPNKVLTVEDQDTQVNILSNRTTFLRLNIDSTRIQTLTLNQAYFPGWKAQKNLDDVPIVADANGLVSMTIPEGVYNLTISFSKTPVRAVADSFSIVGVVIAASLWVYGKKLSVYS